MTDHKAQIHLLTLVEACARELRNPDGDPSTLAAVALRQGRWLQGQGHTDEALEALLGQLETIASAPPRRAVVMAGRIR